ncbi:GDP-mannose 4,6-dehydratase [Smaragdicoccus niigatensis]|uniref:GDP-mannose 4,6-dehydratase n=1 Tax=Smaragdicoccus niigatensis TaxID=359359 RepID=UPI000362866D|nr:GDP-mannose 4,6-dehydratase [Smaragdicoccus niigatensis]
MAAHRTALITGVAGQDGIYLARVLLERGYRVIGTSFSLARHFPYLQGVELIAFDIRNTDAMSELLRRERPDEIYNLAAISSVGQSWQMAEKVAEVNGMSVLRLLELLVRLRDDLGYAPRFYQASSSEIYGMADQQPQDERTPHYPRSPYGTSKSFAHHLTVNYRESYGLYACNGILFNHESPIRPARFVTRKITRAVAEISLGMRDQVTLGNLDARRDWGSAADYVEAMAEMLQQESAQDFVIATGEVASIRDFVAIAFEAVGIEDPWAHVEFDAAYLRPADVPQTWGRADRARSALGWGPKVSLREVVAHMVQADIVRAKTGIEECRGYMFPNTVNDALGLTPATHRHECPSCAAGVAN